MKKNNMLRIASVLLVAVLLSTCAISGAFAKYTTTSGTKTDSARVAKFGFTVTATGGEAFGTMYAKDPQNVIYTPGEDELDTVTAAATTVKTTADVVAPGTKGTLATFTYGGTAEVDVTVARSVALDLADKWVDEKGNFYCPLIIKVGNKTIQTGSTYGPEDTEVDSVTTFEAAVAAAVENEVVEAGETLDETQLSITWEWPFSTGADNDVKDTFLANSANFNGNTIKLTASVTIEQID
jgi:hypothetical protein